MEEEEGPATPEENLRKRELKVPQLTRLCSDQLSPESQEERIESSSIAYVRSIGRRSNLRKRELKD